ncbi:MAG: sulfite exporter TauE/SafE family protein [Chloroflexi bacterium]|nr:MAG: sulfite exporter TauE/SafE family protein [Chloroflexota bacterium]
MNDGLELLGLAGLGFAVGTYGTIVGLGGGFILVPVLLFLYPDYDPEHLTAISLFVVWTNTTSGSIAYARQGRIDYLTGLLFAASSAPGVLAGVFLVDFVPQRAFTIAFALLLLALAAVAVRGPPRGIRQPLSGRGVIVRQMVTAEGTYRYGYRLWQGVILSLGVGLISSVLGIGGGAVHVPVMISTLHFPVMLATATSQFILAFMSGGASVAHLAKGTLSGDQIVKAAALGVGTVPGAQLGARLAGRMKARTVIKLLVAGLLVLSFRLFLKGIAGS